MSYLSDLHELRTLVHNQLKDLTAAGRPDYSIDGQSEKWQSLLDQLWKMLRDLDALLAQAEGPFEISTHGTTA